MIEVTEQEKEYFSKVEPIGEKVIIKRDVFSKSGLIQFDGQGKYRPVGTVVAVSPECKIIKVGDVVGWASTTMLEVINIQELKEEPQTEGNYVSTVETYLTYKLK